MHVSIVGPVCVWIDRLPGGSTPSSESLGFAERAAAQRMRRPADRSCFIAGRALRRRVLSTFAQEPAEALRFVEHGRPRLVGHDDISFSLARAWVADEDAHAIVLGVSRGVEVGAGVVADAAVAELSPCRFMTPGEPALGAAAAWAGKDAVRRLSDGRADPREIRLDPVEVRGEPRHDVELAWRPLPGACVAVAWAPRPRAALARAA
jgi:hypothetical protein